VTDKTFTTVRIVQSWRGVAVQTVKPPLQQSFLVGVGVPSVTRSIFVEPVRGVKPRSTSVAALTVIGVRRTGSAGYAPCEVVPVAVHAERTVRFGIRSMSRSPTGRMAPVTVHEVQRRILDGGGTAEGHGSQ